MVLHYYLIWSIHLCYEPVWPVHNNTSSRWSLLQVQGTDFVVRWLITLSTALHSSVISQWFVKFQGSGGSRGLEPFLWYEFYFSFIFFAFTGRSDSMVSEAVTRFWTRSCAEMFGEGPEKVTLTKSLNFLRFLAVMPRTGAKKLRIPLRKADRNCRSHHTLLQTQ